VGTGAGTGAVTGARVAAIDVGTNTTLLLVAEVATSATGDPLVLADRAEITRLGRGIGSDGRLGKEGIERTLAVLNDYAALARDQGARIAAIGTEALRRAPNAADFLEPAARILGAPIDVITGDREAALTFRAAAASFPREAAGVMTVVDIGGGSTEIVIAEAGHITWRGSLPLGSVRLTERHVHHDPPEPDELSALSRAVSETLAAVPFPRSGTLIGTAGTVTSLAAMALKLDDYDAARVHGFRLGAEDLAWEVARLGRATAAERESIAGLDPRRADVIGAGALIVAEITRRAAAAEVLVSDRGIRWGLLYESLGSR